MQTSRLISVGLAIFAMLFGAGNVVFPLSLGRDTGTEVLYAVLGFIATGVLVPLLGLVSAALFGGDYRKFLGMAGRWPGALIAFFSMILVGPFGATPRCITLAHGATRWHIPGLDLFTFSIIAAVLIYIASIKRNIIVNLMGRIFGPIKLVLLFTIIFLGLVGVGMPLPSTLGHSMAFMRGFADGYQTLDLIATIFFSSLIITAIKAGHSGTQALTPRQIAGYGLKAGVIGGSLLGLVYVGFSFAASKHGSALAFVENTQLLSALAELLLGARASILANITTAIACMTTAIALSAVFAEYLSVDVFRGKIKYAHALLITVALNMAMTNLGFSGLAQVIEPMVIVCYPALIVLSLANIAHALWGFKHVQHVVIATVVFNTALTAYHHGIIQQMLSKLA